MIITIEAPFSISQADKRHIEDKINSLHKYEPRMTKVNVYFKVDDGKDNDAILAEILVRVPGKDIFAEKTSPDALIAFGDTFETVKRQLAKRQDQLNEHQSDVKAVNALVQDNF